MVVGLTGGIGSGKSTVLNMFESLGIAIYVADIEAKKIMNTSVVVKEKIIALLGKEAYKGGKLNRTYIASIVFKESEKLKALNAIVHPEVKKHFRLYSKNIEAPYLVYENAILFESKAEALCDSVILVTAPIEKRIDRVTHRDNTTREAVLSRINNQMTDAEKELKSDYIIENVDLEVTKKEVLRIHEILVKKVKLEE